jgi:hypothetical protein
VASVNFTDGTLPGETIDGNRPSDLLSHHRSASPWCTSPKGWFVVGGGRNGMEYSVLLILCLVVIALDARRQKA